MCWILLGFAPIIEAKEKRFIIDHTYFETFTVRNPFQSQLPREEKKKRIEEWPEVKPVQPPQILMPPPPKPVVAEPPPVVKEEPPPREEPIPSLTITGVVWNTDRPQAVVNCLVVNIGDEVAGVKILNIRKTGIEVLFSGKTVTLQP